MVDIQYLAGIFIVGLLLLLISTGMELMIARDHLDRQGSWSRGSLIMIVLAWIVLIGGFLTSLAFMACLLSAVSLALISNLFRMVSLYRKEGRHRSDVLLIVLRIAFFVLPPLLVLVSVFILFVASEARYQ